MPDVLMTGLLLTLIGAPVVIHCVLWPLSRAHADVVYWSILFLCTTVVAACIPIAADDRHPWQWDCAFVAMGAVWVAFGAFLAGLVRQYGKEEPAHAVRLPTSEGRAAENDAAGRQRKSGL